MMKDKFNTKSAGLFNEKPVQKETIAWADTIIVMEEQQRKEIAKRFPKYYLQKRILNLNIPDIYQYNQYELKKRIKESINRVITKAIN